MEPSSALSLIDASARADQIGIVVKDVEGYVSQIKAMLHTAPFQVVEWPIPGRDPRSMYYGKPAHWRMKLAFGQIGSMNIELIEPLQGRSIFADFLSRHGPGIHHIRFDVADFVGTTAALVSAGIREISSGTGVHRGSRWAYFDTSSVLGGLLLEVRAQLGQQGNRS